MRPVEKGPGPAPLDPALDVERERSRLRRELRDAIGRYCSYCERAVQSGIHLEHKQPKDAVPDNADAWANLLLACLNCNSSKPKRELHRTAYHWPDECNTAWVFSYGQDGEVHPNPELEDEQVARALRTLELTGLDRGPGHPEHSGLDERWNDRREAWQIAAGQRINLALNPGSVQRDRIEQVARAVGFFSVWMTVFRDDPDMCHRFIAAFPGTACGCFDENGAPKPSVEREGVDG